MRRQRSHNPGQARFLRGPATHGRAQIRTETGHRLAVDHVRAFRPGHHESSLRRYILSRPAAGLPFWARAVSSRARNGGSTPLTRLGAGMQPEGLDRMRNTADNKSSMRLAMLVSVGLVLGGAACKKSSDQPATQAGYPTQAPDAVPVQQAPGYGDWHGATAWRCSRRHRPLRRSRCGARSPALSAKSAGFAVLHGRTMLDPPLQRRSRQMRVAVSEPITIACRATRCIAPTSISPSYSRGKSLHDDLGTERVRLRRGRSSRARAPHHEPRRPDQRLGGGRAGQRHLDG